MKVYEKESSVRLQISLKEAWAFFSSPQNLSRLTPKELGFTIMSNPDNLGMYPGKLFYYRVTPLLGIPMTWVSEITACEEEKYFIDVQVSGPYSLWHHEHRFEETEGGVIVRDIIHYALPLGPLGQLMNALTVKKKIDSIFEYREKVMNEIFVK